MNTNTTTKTTAAKTTKSANLKIVKGKGKATAVKTGKEISAADIAKMTKWNEKHPDAKFSWIVIGANTPTAHQTCKSCAKKLSDGRVTRLTSEGHAVCGPRCQLKATTRPAKAEKTKKTTK